MENPEKEAGMLTPRHRRLAREAVSEMLEITGRDKRVKWSDAEAILLTAYAAIESQMLLEDAGMGAEEVTVPEELELVVMTGDEFVMAQRDFEPPPEEMVSDEVREYLVDDEWVPENILFIDLARRAMREE